MWIREVDLPEALIEAHRGGNLAIFVGAGASRDAPSDLPDFSTLAADIAAEAQVEVTEPELAQPDVLLGRLADREVDVHRRVAARIGVPSSKPNRLHEAIVDLAVAGPSVRLVTTNYDPHLSTLLSARDVQVVEYMGPALPMGDDFTGLVYLHGSLSQEPRQLMVTDGDFGRAYLRDAWAARFLERMFATYTVLFIGYSHSDIVMRYLARALGPGAPRYVLTSTPDAPDWRALGINPVGYQVASGSHAALVDAIEGWASLSSMGLLDHRQRVAQLVSAPPSQVPEEASYLEALVADNEKVLLFAELARGEEWLSWASAQAEFRRLFDPGAAPTDCAPTLAYWFAEHFVMDEDLTSAALKVVREAAGRLGLPVWSAIGHHLHVRGSPRPEWLRPWLVLLIQNDPDTGQDWLEYALVASRWPEDRTVGLLLFDHLTEPRAVLQPSFGLSGGPRFGIQLRGDGHWLQEAWQTLFLPRLAEAAPAVLAIVDRHLRRAHQLLIAADSAGPEWDPISFRRSAVDAHPQDSFREPIDVLIDATRDCLEAMLDGGDDLGVVYLNTWAGSDVPMLRRLAVHGWVHRTDVDATEKIVWLRERGWLFDHQLRHEVFRLMETALPSAASDVADALVEDVVAGPTDVDDAHHHAYERFNALAWITRHAPDLQSAQEAFAQVKMDHPDFAVRPHPDLLSWSETGTVGSRPPMTAAELHERIGADAASAIAELRRYEGASSAFEGPTWQDALDVLEEAVRDQPADGFAILDAEGGDHPDIVRGVVRGWASATNDGETAEAILDRLEQVDLALVADDLSRLLSDGGRSDANPTEWHRFLASRQLAADLWATLEEDASASDVDDWLGRAINRPAGRLALFWVHAVAADWRAAGDSWEGIPAETRDRLEVLLADNEDRTAMAEVVFASQLHFFFGADRAWCENHVLPLLDWADPTRAVRAWDGYLTWGRWNDQLLAAGLLEHYLASANNIDELREESRRRLCEHLAAVAVSSEVNPVPWMRTFTVTVGVADRVEWMNQVTWMLSQLPAEAVEHQWQRWMGQYWQDRLDSIPVQLTVEEASAMAAWVVYLTDSIEVGVRLATAHPAALGEHSNLLHALDDGRLDRGPAAFAKLLAHLLRGTHPPFWGGHYLAKIVPRLREQSDPEYVKAIVEEAIRLGCGNATGW
jgi:hypothetical protein